MSVNLVGPPVVALHWQYRRHAVYRVHVPSLIFSSLAPSRFSEGFIRAYLPLTFKSLAPGAEYSLNLLFFSHSFYSHLISSRCSDILLFSSLSYIYSSFFIIFFISVPLPTYGIQRSYTLIQIYFM